MLFFFRIKKCKDFYEILGAGKNSEGLAENSWVLDQCPAK
jgi:hypothetical protein